MLAAAVIGGSHLNGSFVPAYAQSDATATPMPTPEDMDPLLLTIHGLPGYGVAPLTTGFVMTSPIDMDDPVVSYEWNLGDGSTANMPPPALFHTYAVPGVYTVTVTATTASGRLGTAMTAVVVRPPSD
jgi:cytochrome c